MANVYVMTNGSRVETERKQKGPQMKTAAAAFVYFIIWRHLSGFSVRLAVI